MNTPRFLSNASHDVKEGFPAMTTPTQEVAHHGSNTGDLTDPLELWTPTGTYPVTQSAGSVTPLDTSAPGTTDACVESAQCATQCAEFVAGCAESAAGCAESVGQCAGGFAQLTDDIHRARVLRLGDEAEGKKKQVIYAWEASGRKWADQTYAWLQARRIAVSQRYVQTVVKQLRKENGLADTSDLPALTDEVYAELQRLDAEAHSDPETQELARQVRWAQRRLQYQNDPALREALSDEELRADHELAVLKRNVAREKQHLELNAELKAVRRELATAAEDAKSQAQQARWSRRALRDAQKVSTPEASLVSAYREFVWSSRAATVVVLVGMLYSAINVQRNLAPGGAVTDPLFWVAYGIEAMASVAMILLMRSSDALTRRGMASQSQATTDTDRSGRLARLSSEHAQSTLAEIGLLSFMVILNIGPHVAAGAWGQVARTAIAPLMVAVMLRVHAVVSNRYRRILARDEQACTRSAKTASAKRK